jgi:hypothetical protein
VPGQAPQRFVDWLRGHTFVDRRGKLPAGLRLQYHSRSVAHSKKLCELILEDLVDTCLPIRQHAAAGRVVYGIDYTYTWPNGKSKKLDLAIGTPTGPVSVPFGTGMARIIGKNAIARLLIACEAKTTATEHHKSQPRIYSELNDAHTIVHQGDRWAIAAGIEMVNIATTFISPLRQRPDRPVVVTTHTQPAAAANIVEHLRKLPRRDRVDTVGLDALCTFVVELDNQGRVAPWTAPPAPQPGDLDHYDTFLHDICQAYERWFSDVDHLPEPGGLSIEEALRALGAQYPGLLSKAGELVANESRPGAAELQAILQDLDTAKPPLPEE